MKLYLTFSSMPELQSLPASERKAAYSELVHPLLMERQVRWAKFGFMWLLVSSCIFAGFMDSTLRFILFLVGFFVADHVFDLSAIRLLRSKLATAVSAKSEMIRSD